MTAANILLFMALCMGVVGVSMIGASIALQNSIRKKKQICTIPVKAVIADLERSDNISMQGLRTVSWFPVYEYQVRDHIIRKRSNMGHTEQIFFTGQTVTIYVNPENENEFYCPAEKSGKIQIIFLLLGGLLLILAIAALAVYKMMRG